MRALLRCMDLYLTNSSILGRAQSCLTPVTPWTVARQASLFIGLPRQEYWSGLPFPSPGDLSDPGIEFTLPALQAVSWPASGFFTKTGSIPNLNVRAPDSSNISLIGMYPRE